MKIGVIGSGSIGPDLAYGFLSALAKAGGGEVVLVDIKEDALRQGVERIQGYLRKGLAGGKIRPELARSIEKALVTSGNLNDLADCDYVLEAATEDLSIKQRILADLEQAVGPDCLVGFATSGIPRAQIAAKAKYPGRCFVNHPFFPAWRSLPMEVVASDDAAATERMTDLLWLLGKVPIVTADVPCFAADDIFCNYCSEAARIVEEGVATPAQVDRIVNDAIGGGGPFQVMDLTRGNLLTAHCQELMREAPTGGSWFAPPAILARQGSKPWHEGGRPGDGSHDAALRKRVLDRILAVLLSRTVFVAENDICEPTELDWMTRTALGFRKGLLSLAEEHGAGRLYELCAAYAAAHPGFPIPRAIQEKRLPAFRRNVKVAKDGDLAVVTVFRPEVRNALNEPTMEELDAAFTALEADDGVRGIILTGAGGALAGADIMELAALRTPDEARDKCRRGQAVLDRIAALRKPVVAAVDGPVLGGGCEISMACHGRVVGQGLMLGQPEVNLGIIPGYGGTQRLPRLIGVERALALLRTGRTVGAREACQWGWAAGEPAANPLAAARDLLRRHLQGMARMAPVNPEPVALPDPIPAADLGHRSRAIDGILLDVVREGMARPLAAGLSVEADGFARCRETVDYDIGMRNFIQNGPRVPAVFMHE